MNNLNRRLSQLEQSTRNPLHDISDDELHRRAADLDKRMYAIASVGELEAEVKEIEAVILTKKGFYGGGIKEQLERLANQEG